MIYALDTGNKNQMDFFVSYAFFTATHSSFLQLSFSAQSEIAGTTVALYLQK